MEAPQLQKQFWEAYRDKGLLVVAIDLCEGEEKEPWSEQRGRAEGYQQNLHLTFPVLVDLDKASTPNFKKDEIVTPSNVLVDDQGMVRYSALGFAHKGEPLSRKVAELLGVPARENQEGTARVASP